MRLSEAILLSIGAVREDRGTFFMSNHESGPCGCAIGTALFSIGAAEEAQRYGSAVLEKYWPWTASPSARIRKKTGLPMPVSMEISDRHYFGESRESLAAYIATIEPVELESPALSPVAQGQEVGA